MNFNLLRKQSRHSRTAATERGFTLLEVMAVLVIIGVAGSMLATSWADNAKNMKSKSTAEKLQMVVRASEDYLVANRADLLSLTGAGAVIAVPAGKTCAACAQPTTPAPLQTLQADGFLPSSYIDMNSDQQSHALLVKQVAGELEAIVTTYGGGTVEDDEIGYISSLIGASAGGVYNNAVFGPSNEISGAQGSWGDTTANWAASIGATQVTPSAGTVQVSMSMAEVTGSGGTGLDPNDVLHRTPQSDPSLNAMSTNLDMGGFDIANTGAITATSVNGGAITASSVNGGAITATSVNGGTITASGVTSSFDIRAPRFVDSDDPTNRYLDPHGNSQLQNISISGTTAAAGAMRVSNYFYAKRLFDIDDPTFSFFVDPAEISQISVLRTTSDVTAGGNMVINGTTTATGAVTVNNTVSATRFIDRDSSSYAVDPSGTSTLNTVNAASITATTSSSAPVFTATTRMESPVYMTTSDRRLKEDIRDLAGMEIVKRLNAKSYKMKKSGKESMGLIAQDVEEVVPFAVHTNEVTGMKSVNYIELIAPMIDAIKELDERVEDLEAAN